MLFLGPTSPGWSDFMIKLCQTVLIILALRLWYGIHVVPLKCKLATVKGKKADISSVSPSSEQLSNV